MVEQQSNELDFDAIFRALAHSIRRETREQLPDGPESVGDLAEPHGVSLAVVSKHLHLLENSGLLDIHTF